MSKREILEEALDLLYRDIHDYANWSVKLDKYRYNFLIGYIAEFTSAKDDKELSGILKVLRDVIWFLHVGEYPLPTSPTEEMVEAQEWLDAAIAGA